MKKVRHIATFADLLILAIVVIINPTSPITPYHPFKAPCISDKVEVRYTKALSTDSLTQSLKKTEAQLSEMKYYLKVHNVTDEGYNQVAHYNQTLLDRKDWLQRIFELSAANRLPSPSSQTITIPAKDRPLIAVKLSKGHWHAGHFTFTPLYGKALTRDYQGRIVSAVYVADTVVSAIRIDSAGVYQGQVDSYLQANGQGTYLAFGHSEAHIPVAGSLATLGTRLCPCDAFAVGHQLIGTRCASPRWAPVIMRKDGPSPYPLFTSSRQRVPTSATDTS